MDKCGNCIKISITGDLGSGKSTVCNYLKEHYGLKVYSIGQIQRSLAQRYNMDVLAFNKFMETHPEIDGEIDAELAMLGKRSENMVFDSRMAWHFVPDSFKVYLTVDIDEAARRVMKDQRGKVEMYPSADDAKACLVARKESENLRYITKYGVDCSNLDNYDLVIDTTSISPREAAEKIMSEYRRQCR
jgi:cytidylate kinase